MDGEVAVAPEPALECVPVPKVELRFQTWSQVHLMGPRIGQEIVCTESGSLQWKPLFCLTFLRSTKFVKVAQAFAEAPLARASFFCEDPEILRRTHYYYHNGNLMPTDDNESTTIGSLGIKDGDTITVADEEIFFDFEFDRIEWLVRADSPEPRDRINLEERAWPGDCGYSMNSDSDSDLGSDGSERARRAQRRRGPRPSDFDSDPDSEKKKKKKKHKKEKKNKKEKKHKKDKKRKRDDGVDGDSSLPYSAPARGRGKVPS